MSPSTPGSRSPSWLSGGIRAGSLALERALPGSDAIVLLAYRPPPDPASAPRHEREVNLAGAKGIGEAAARVGARVVFTSSADVYGPWRDEPVTEEDEAEPRTPYAEAKLEAERVLSRIAGEGASVNLRVATVFGPGEDGPRAIPSFIRSYLRGREPVLHGDGSDVRDYVQIVDVASAIVNACLRPAPAPTINLGSGVGRSTIDVLRAVAGVMGVEPRARREPSRRAASRLIVDPTLARRELGFDPREDFEAALREEARWLQNRSRGDGAGGRAISAAGAPRRADSPAP